MMRQWVGRGGGGHFQNQPCCSSSSSRSRVMGWLLVSFNDSVCPFFKLPSSFSILYLSSISHTLSLPLPTPNSLEFPIPLLLQLSSFSVPYFHSPSSTNLPCSLFPLPSLWIIYITVQEKEDDEEAFVFWGECCLVRGHQLDLSAYSDPFRESSKFWSILKVDHISDYNNTRKPLSYMDLMLVSSDQASFPPIVASFLIKMPSFFGSCYRLALQMP